MNEKIMYREYKPSDSRELAEIIRRTWNYDRFCSAKTAERMARLYLFSCLCNQTFTCVATSQGRAVGIIMGKNIRKHRCPVRLRIKQLSALFKLLISREGRRVMNMFGGIDGLDEKMLKRTGIIYSGELSFFAVDEGFRGCGIGKRLFEELKSYMENENIDNFYLYTDTSCNYRFYENNGMQRRDQEHYTVTIDEKSEDMEFFVYDLNLEHF